MKGERTKKKAIMGDNLGPCFPNLFDEKMGWVFIRKRDFQVHPPILPNSGSVDVGWGSGSCVLYTCPG